MFKVLLLISKFNNLLDIYSLIVQALTSLGVVLFLLITLAQYI